MNPSTCKKIFMEELSLVLLVCPLNIASRNEYFGRFCRKRGYLNFLKYNMMIDSSCAFIPLFSLPFFIRNSQNTCINFFFFNFPICSSWCVEIDSLSSNLCVLLQDMHEWSDFIKPNHGVMTRLVHKITTLLDGQSRQCDHIIHYP